VTNIASGTWDEVFGAVWDPSRKTFLVTDINSRDVVLVDGRV
jgi:hypothetical protein